MSQRSGRGGGVKPVGTKSQVPPKIPSGGSAKNEDRRKMRLNQLHSQLVFVQTGLQKLFYFGPLGKDDFDIQHHLHSIPFTGFHMHLQGIWAN